ncbi:MAG TPA: hypothetical protein VN958_20705 [Chitinophagaceae bacterium]|nr:hypothetical protein [Chitinophagaceae bacterium]
MTSYTEIAHELAKSYVQAKNKKYALNQMIFEINYLADPQSNQPLDFSSKSVILKFIHELLSGQKTFELREGEEITPEFRDITIFFERKNFILKQLNICNKRKALFN